MKKKLLALLSLFLALVVFFSPCICSLDKVSAVGQEFNFPQEWIDSSVNADQYRNYFEALENNPEFVSTYPSNYVVMFSGVSQNEISVYIIDPVNFYTLSRSWSGDTFDFYTGKFSLNTIAPSLLNQYLFTTTSELSPENNTSQLFNSAGMVTDYHGQYYWFRGVSFYYNNELSLGTVNYPVAVFSGTNEHPFDPIIDPLYNAAYSLYINETEFTEWLINNGRYTEISSAMLANHVSETVSIFRKYGGNNSAFGKLLKQFFDLRNIGIGISDYNVVISKIRQLYREFEQERKQELLNKFYNRTDDTENIKPDTNEINNTLITNNSNDDIYTSLLRDILRALLALPNNIRDVGFSIIDAINSLDNTVNIVNDGGIDDINFPDLEDLFIPTYSGFDDLEDQFFDKFPFLLDLKDLPEIEDYLEEEDQGDSLQVAALSAGSEAVVVDPLKTRDDLFRFTVPENNKFMNGAVSGMSIDFASFTKFASAIEALKGIISVIALFGFSHWLIKFAPKLLHGYASSD